MQQHSLNSRHSSLNKSYSSAQLLPPCSPMKKNQTMTKIYTTNKHRPIVKIKQMSYDVDSPLFATIQVRRPADYFGSPARSMMGSPTPNDQKDVRMDNKIIFSE